MVALTLESSATLERSGCQQLHFRARSDRFLRRDISIHFNISGNEEISGGGLFNLLCHAKLAHRKWFASFEVSASMRRSPHPVRS